MKATDRPTTRARVAEPAKQDGDAALLALFARYRRSRSLELRDRLIERYRGHVEAIARRIVSRLPRHVESQDLVHAGIFGLIQAIESYEPARGAHFLAFMRLRVRGAILDELRQLDHVPRQQRSRIRILEAARRRLRAELLREPSDLELAVDLGISESALRQRYLQVLVRCALPTGMSKGDGDDEFGNDLDGVADEGVEPPFEALHRRDLLEQIERTLDPTEWAVLRLHYLEGLTGRQVARKLRLSAARICQIHLRVLARLKDRLSLASPA